MSARPGLIGATAADIAEAVRSGEASAVSVVEAHLERIQKLDDDLGAFQLVRPERAMDEARRLAARSDIAELPLAGVPIAVKDNVAVAGEPTREGSRATPEEPATRDHEVVRRIREAGAIVIGKTRVPELCTFGATDSAFGITRNPWSLERTPGGSSGGSAAAVAGGLVPIAHGNDGMGSVRLPSACCGLIGIKPGTGVVPVDLGPNDWYGLAENGSIATTVEDVALLLSVMAARPELARPEPPDERLRIAVSTKSPVAGVRIDPEWKSATVRTGEALASLGHSVDSGDPPYSTRHNLAATLRWFAGVDDDAELFGREKLEKRNRRHASFGRIAKRRGWAGPEGAAAWRSRLAPFFERFDILLTPAMARPPILAVEWGKRSWTANVVANARFSPFTSVWNLADYPAMAVPAGVHTSGTPLSVQLVAPAGGEALLLGVARQIEESRPWPRHAPMAGL